MVDFARVNWVSPSAKKEWEPRLQRVNDLWRSVEINSINKVEGRKIAVVFIGVLELVNFFVIYPNYEIVPVVLEGHGINASVPGDDVYRCFVGESRDVVDKAIAAWHYNDDRALGRFLGFPECCMLFFEQEWKRNHFKDLTHRMLNPHEGINMMLKSIGIRPVFHLPCSGMCTRSRDLADEIHDSIWDEEVKATLLEMHRWPMSYSIVNGIAEIKTPAFRLATSSDILPEKFYVERDGLASKRYVYGNEFPNRQLDAQWFRQSRSDGDSA